MPSKLQLTTFAGLEVVILMVSFGRPGSVISYGAGQPTGSTDFTPGPLPGLLTIPVWVTVRVSLGGSM